MIASLWIAHGGDMNPTLEVVEFGVSALRDWRCIAETSARKSSEAPSRGVVSTTMCSIHSAPYSRIGLAIDAEHCGRGFGGLLRPPNLEDR
jgi:hypothetical protein